MIKLGKKEQKCFMQKYGGKYMKTKITEIDYFEELN